MRLDNIGSNQTVISYKDGLSVLFSYKTPVAAFVPGRGYVKSSSHYSKTTSRHVNSWIGSKELGEVVTQNELDEIIGQREN